MNTINELLDNGINIDTANRMLNSYLKRINTMNGIYKITDITYDFSIHGKDITLECTSCGRIIHRTMINGKNKWSELIKNCECQKVKKQTEKQLVSENSAKIKKATIVERIGKIFGDFEIVSAEDLDKNPKYTMRCTECGNEKIVSANCFNRLKDFHCTKHYVCPVKFDESYIGKKNNFLTVCGYRLSKTK